MPSGISEESDLCHLLDKARAGDAGATEQILLRYHEFVWRVSQGSVADRLASKLGSSDIAQQSILEAQRNLANFNGRTDGELKAWLTSVIRNNSIDASRQYRSTERRDVGREIELSAQEAMLHADGASSVFRQEERDEELAKAISQLPVRKRALIELRHRDGLSYAEIAERLAISEAAARKLWSRTLLTLRDLLTEHDG